MTALDPTAIPAVLRARPQWVNWRYEERDGKPTKAPINPKSNGRLRYAKTNDPRTWSDFDTALKACGTHPELEGVGFCFAPDDGLTGLDLDHVLDPATGEIKPQALEVLERFSGTYAEVSPSRTGFRLFCRGRPGRSGKNTGTVKWLEVYQHPSHRYLTVTGKHWPGNANEVTDQQDALDWLHERFMVSTEGVKPSPRPVDTGTSLDLDDAALLDKARAAKNGAQFARLWSGDTSGHGGDDSAADLALCNLLAFWTDKDAGRMDRLFRQSGLMRGKWEQRHGERTYGEMTIAKAIGGMHEGYTGRKALRQEAAPRSAGTDDNQSLGIDPYRGTDEANATLFLEMHGEDVRYCPPWEKWLIWSGSRWRIDDRLDIYRLAADLPRAFYRRAADEADPKTRQAMAALAKVLESTNRQSNFLFSARCRVVVHHADLDKGRFLLNAKNGTVDLETGGIRPHRRADLLTHDTEIHYDPAAMCPTWERFLSEVFQGDSELIVFLQRAIGYSLTGSVTEQILLICFGCGSNGKSVFLNILRKLLGTLALQAAPDLLMADRNRRHPTEQADLFGKRLVVCQETAEGRRFNESLVKQLTGGDAIRARRMHEDFWEFEPTHKLWLSTNHRPEIKGTDHAIWRRVRLVPFNVQFTDDGPNRKDKGMEAKLTAELPGILAWAVRGCLDWQRHGLGMAEAVKVATEAYRADMDVLAAWLGECCIVKRTAEAKAADLYKSYTDWCDASGESPEPQRRFGMRLTERGFTRQRRMAGHFWLGIGLKSTHHDPNDPNDPEKASFGADSVHEAKYAKSGSYGSYRSCNPPDTDTHHEPNEPYEPEKAIFRANSLTKLKLPNKVHDGSYGSCKPPDAGISSHLPPVELASRKHREVFE